MIMLNKLKKIYYVVLSVLTGLLLTIISFIMVFETYALSEAFYIEGFKAYEVKDIVNISEDDLEQVTHEMVTYLNDRSGDLHVMVTIDGVSTEYFNAKEQAHLTDIMNLIRHGREVLQLLKYMLLGLLVMHVSVPMSKRFNFFKYSVFWAIGFLAILGLSYFMDFNSAFIKFHEMLFYNDLWMLDITKDRLLQMMPLEFFMRFTRYWLLTVLGLEVLFMVLYFLLKRVAAKHSPE